MHLADRSSREWEQCCDDWLDVASKVILDGPEGRLDQLSTLSGELITFGSLCSLDVGPMSECALLSDGLSAYDSDAVQAQIELVRRTLPAMTKLHDRAIAQQIKEGERRQRAARQELVELTARLERGGLKAEAIQALALLAEKEGSKVYFSRETIASKIEVGRAGGSLKTPLGDLKKSGIVETERGATGGARLTSLGRELHKALERNRG